NLGWRMGALWAVDPERRILRCRAAWVQPTDAPKSALMDATLTSTFPSGVGLPGRVWADGRAAWIPDVLRDDNFPRGEWAAADGLHAAFGFPILLGRDVLGVIEFFHDAIREPDQELLQAMSVIGSQIGQFMERTEVERAVLKSEARK